jgi:hypothetical protein
VRGRRRRAPLETGRGGTPARGAAFGGRGVRYGLYHGRPRELPINVALCWRVSKSRAKDPRRAQPEGPWYLATSLKNAESADSWYWQRGWIEQSFKDAKGRRMGEGERDQYGAHAVGGTRGSAASLSTSTIASGVGGYASDFLHT